MYLKWVGLLLPSISSLLNNRSVVFPASWHCPQYVKFFPNSASKVEAYDIVESTATTVATEDVKGFLVNDTRGPAALAWLYGRVELHLAPAPRWGAVDG